MADPATMNSPSPAHTLPVRVWAPLASSVHAVLVPSRPGTDGLTEHPLTPDGDGYWSIDLPVGTDYLLSVDGGEPRPDPRSAWQPFGVHGPSRVFDSAAYAWADVDWPGRDVLGGVFYELHVGTFTPEGTLDAAIGRLGHLVELGIDTIELMPLAPFPGERGWGYDGVELYAVHEHYGGPAALQRFVDAAHAHGLAVCLDVVYNHFGPAGNYAPAFGPYFTQKHHTPWGAAINLDDAHAGGVRAFIVDNALRWLRDFHIDALRLDAVHALHDDSPRHILAELADAVADFEQASGRRATLIAESDLNQVAMIAPTAAHPGDTGDPALAGTPDGRGMDGQWADDVHHALHAWLTGERFGYYGDFGSAETLAHAFERVFVHDGGYSSFRGSDWGAPVPDAVDRRRFVTFTQNHDQVGNRGLGDRPDERLSPGQAAAGAALLLLSPFTPLLFQGQEWGTRRPFRFFCDHDADLGQLVTQGRTKEFAEHGWEQLYGPQAAIPDPQSPDTCAGCVLDWAELGEVGHTAMLDWYRRLIELRREYGLGESHQGRLPVRARHGEGWFALTHGPLTVVASPHTDGRADLGLLGLGEPSFLARHGDVRIAGSELHLAAPAVVVLGSLSTPHLPLRVSG
ncbi:MAG: malto-oligosyltrehalose trehalohydrolase [Propioniciclava sp.]|uniref:malto-oligosyltrehalose trehalohydrolase n=1 Tax=Propioniciclava sp. TaxID=2038686 RepID=UPI0039E53F86